jgi:hypothetical protein
MVDTATFLTMLSVLGDDFCKTSLPPEQHPGLSATLSRSAAGTVAIFGE